MPITGSVSGSSLGFVFGLTRSIDGYIQSEYNSTGWINFVSSIKTGATGINKDLYLNATQSASEGYSSPPCLELNGKTIYRFRWALPSGSHSIQIYAKQTYSGSAADRPSLYVSPNYFIGLTGSFEFFAASGSSDWTLIGPIQFTTDIAGGTWVELRSNCTIYQNNPCYFDEITKT